MDGVFGSFFESGPEIFSFESLHTSFGLDGPIKRFGIIQIIPSNLKIAAEVCS